MQRSKEPIAYSAAGGAIDRDDEASQLDLFLLPQNSVDDHVATVRSTDSRSDSGNAPEPAVKSGGGSMMSAPERKTVRRKRLDTPVSVTPIKRTIAAAIKSGVSVSSLEVRPDGSFVLTTAQPIPAPSPAIDVFEQWADSL